MLVSCVCVCDWFDDLMILFKKKKTQHQSADIGRVLFLTLI